MPSVTATKAATCRKRGGLGRRWDRDRARDLRAPAASGRDGDGAAERSDSVPDVLKSGAGYNGARVKASSVIRHVKRDGAIALDQSDRGVRAIAGVLGGVLECLQQQK